MPSSLPTYGAAEAGLLERLPGVSAAALGGSAQIATGIERACAELAAQLHLEPSYFRRLFRKNFGMSHIRYILQRRIKIPRSFFAVVILPLSVLPVATGLATHVIFPGHSSM